MKKIIRLKLKFFAKLILKKYKPKVIGVTGSVGKTSTREAIFSVLNKKYNTRRSFKNYNNELGLPLTIIGVKSPRKSIFGWSYVFLYALKLILFKDKNYPEILILEMGVDRVGDMDYLNSIVKCDIGVITEIGHSHLEFFKSVKEIQKEKSKLLDGVKKSGWAVLNFDNENISDIAQKTKTKILKYGLRDGVDINANNLIFKFKDDKNNLNNLIGLGFKLNYNNISLPVILSDVIGEGMVYSAMAAASVGIAMGMNLVDIADGLGNLSSPQGRMKLIKGEKGSLIIDDTYNSSPQSSLSAITSIEKIKTGNDIRKIAVLGDMLELGKYCEEAHHMVGKRLVLAGFDILITVGEKARDINRGALKSGMKEEAVFHFDNTEMAGKFLEKRMRSGDLILIKGSQSSRMEKIVKEIMADPLNAKNLLVRQDEEWE